MSNGFTRQETLRLTTLTSNQLSYLDRIGLVVPIKSGHPRHPAVRYTPEKILEVQVIKRLRKQVSSQEVAQAIEFLRSEKYNPRLLKMNLLSFNSKLYWIESHRNLQRVVSELTDKTEGHIMMFTIDPIGDVVSELWDEAKREAIEDFEERVKGSVLETTKQDFMM